MERTLTQPKRKLSPADIAAIIEQGRRSKEWGKGSTVKSKPILVKEPTYELLTTLKENDTSLRSLDDVVSMLLLSYAMVQYDNKGSN